MKSTSLFALALLLLLATSAKPATAQEPQLVEHQGPGCMLSLPENWQSEVNDEAGLLFAHLPKTSLRLLLVHKLIDDAGEELGEEAFAEPYLDLLLPQAKREGQQQDPKSGAQLIALSGQLEGAPAHGMAFVMMNQERALFYGFVGTQAEFDGATGGHLFLTVIETLRLEDGTQLAELLGINDTQD